MTALEKMKGFEFSVSASRTRGNETVLVQLDSTSGAHAMFYMTRAEAYALAHQLQHEADWLARLTPAVEA